MKRDEYLLLPLIIADLLAGLGSWLLAYCLRFSGVIPILKGVPLFITYIKVLPLLILSWLLVIVITRWYHKESYSNRKIDVSILKTLQVSVLSTLVFVSITYFYHEYHLSRLTVLLFSIIHPILLYILRNILSVINDNIIKSSPRPALLIGSYNSLKHTLKYLKLTTFEDIKLKSILFVGDSKDLAKLTKLATTLDISVIQHIPTQWSQFFANNNFDSVLLAVEHSHQDFIHEHMSALMEQVVDLRIIPDLKVYDPYMSNMVIINGNVIAKAHGYPLSEHSLFYKRSLDLIGALLSLIVFSPVFIIISLIIKITSRGPIFYRQERVSINGSKFYILKFRTMTTSKNHNNTWTCIDDNRVFPLGKILRKTSLDELPQLFNVLSGEMSLVGPRPERSRFVNKFRTNIPNYMLRHQVKAGMTGWAQVNGWRGNTSIAKRIELDLFYVKNWSLWFDIKILWQTIICGFQHPNAY